jgi:replicative DNA helicase
MLQDKEFSASVKKVVRLGHFDSDAYKWIYRKIIRESATTIPILVDILKKETKDEKIETDLRKAIAAEVQQFSRDKGKSFDDAKYGLGKVKEFVQTQELADGLLKAASKLKDGAGSKDVRGQLKRVLMQQPEDEIITVNVVTHKDERFKTREEIVKNKELIFVPTGIRELDERIFGPGLGDVWAFFGDTNIGKSCLAVNVGRTDMLLGFRTWHVVLEDKFEMTVQRYDSSITKTNYQKLTFITYTPEEKERIDKIFEILQKKRKEYLYLSKIEEGCTMADIEGEHERIKAVYNFHPMVMLIDSPHCMEPITAQHDSRMKYKRIYEEVRKFARREKIATFLFDQSKFATRGKSVGVEAFSETYDKVRILDGNITINQTKLQQKEGIVELFAGKMKDREKNISFLVRPRPEIIRYESIER